MQDIVNSSARDHFSPFTFVSEALNKFQLQPLQHRYEMFQKTLQDLRAEAGSSTCVGKHMLEGSHNANELGKRPRYSTRLSDDEKERLDTQARATQAVSKAAPTVKKSHKNRFDRLCPVGKPSSQDLVRLYAHRAKRQRANLLQEGPHPNPSLPQPMPTPTHPYPNPSLPQLIPTPTHPYPNPSLTHPIPTQPIPTPTHSYPNPSLPQPIPTVCVPSL